MVARARTVNNEVLKRPKDKDKQEVETKTGMVREIEFVVFVLATPD